MQEHLISGVNILHTYTIYAVSFYYTHGMVLYINDSIYRQNTNIENMYVYASERSEWA